MGCGKSNGCAESQDMQTLPEVPSSELAGLRSLAASLETTDTALNNAELTAEYFDDWNGLLEDDTYPMLRFDDEEHEGREDCDPTACITVGDEVEVRDAHGNWWQATITTKLSTTRVSLQLNDGCNSSWSRIHTRNLRYRLPQFDLSTETTSCTMNETHKLPPDEPQDVIQLCGDIGIGYVDNEEGGPQSVQELLTIAQNNNAVPLPELDSGGVFSVADCGIVAFNGAYVRHGLCHNKPCYRHRSGRTICYFLAGKWVLASDEHSAEYTSGYTVAGNADLPPCVGWLVDEGCKGPPPTLSITAINGFFPVSVGTHIEVFNAGTEEVNGKYTGLQLDQTGKVLFKKDGGPQTIEWHGLTSAGMGWFFTSGSGIYFRTTDSPGKLPTRGWEPYARFPFKPGLVPMPEFTQLADFRYPIAI